MDVAHPQQLLRELGRLRARLDGHILCHLTLILGPNQRIHELRTFEVLDTLRTSNSARRAEKRCRRPRVLPAIAWHRLVHALACTCCACRAASAGHRPHAHRAGRHGLRTPSRTAQPLWCTGRCASRCAARQRPPPASDRRAGPPAVLPVQHGREQVVVAAFATALGLQVSGPTPCDQTR
jgi:hypothetical protein